MNKLQTTMYIPLLAITLCVSALIMFVIEPVAAKIILPLLGGSSYVWNTCVVFFQSVLLSAYVLVYLLHQSKLKLKAKLFIHVAIVWLPLFTLPLRPPVEEPLADHPYSWLLYTLTYIIGPVFFSISTTAPTVQKWLADSTLPQAKDPYFLYAISNFAGLLALIAYPFFIEPHFSLLNQLDALSFAYAIFALLTTTCALATFKNSSNKTEPVIEQAKTDESTEDESQPHYLLWILLTALPASLMLGLTNYVTSELASIPLFWMVPLAIYMLSFTIAFTYDCKRFLKEMVILSVASALLVFGLLFNESKVHYDETVASGLVTSGISLHLICLFLVALTCHAKVAATRPSTRHLTAYYLVIALGGILGSSFNSFIAPLIFNDIFEYQLALAISASALICTFRFEKNRRFLKGSAIYIAASVVLALLVCKINQDPRDIVSKRNFFGVLKIKTDQANKTVQIWNGVTLHGGELIDKDGRNKPIFYYGESSPVKDVFEILEEKNSSLKQNPPYAMLGLGAGALSHYAKPGQELLIYELNPGVIDIASNPFYFTYLHEARKRGVKIETVSGDARVNIKKAPNNFLQLIVLDTFSSDSIPLHLITKEAMSSYQTKLKDDGSILFHVTNTYYDLKKPIARVAQSLGFDAVARDTYTSARTKFQEPTDWILISKDKSLLEQLKNQYNWQEIVPDEKMRLWTDDYYDPLKVLYLHFS
ncbi:MAG: fused MFS/spermidine synthase [Cyanobacteria bacterium TGS_CYA1]|nr:fused MFS/spermidine synthase [Cyanobacteria bacterium TGS_CYA1]